MSKTGCQQNQLSTRIEAMASVFADPVATGKVVSAGSRKKAMPRKDGFQEGVLWTRFQVCNRIEEISSTNLASVRTAI